MNIISLPMYDWPEVQKSYNLFYLEFKNQLTTLKYDLPDILERQMNIWDSWYSQNLLLSQTCGFPYVQFLKGKTHHLGSPIYNNGCKPGFYNSVIITHKDNKACTLYDLNLNGFGCNSLDSQSGYMALQSHFLKNNLSPIHNNKITLTGSHRHSIKAVANGEIEFAAIDNVTWQLALTHEPASQLVKILENTDEMPTLPFITSLSFQRDSNEISTAIKNTILSLKNLCEKDLFLTGFIPGTESNYSIFKDKFNILENALKKIEPNS